MKNFNRYNVFSGVCVPRVLLLTGFVITSSYSPVLVADTSVNQAGEKERTVSADNHISNAGTKQRGKDAWVLQAEQWELARSGETVIMLPVLRQVVDQWLLEKDRRIEVQYPGGEEGELWVQQLTDWLVALGIPSGHLIAVPGSGADDIIKFDLVQ